LKQKGRFQERPFFIWIGVFRHRGIRVSFETHVMGALREGMPVTWTFYLDDGSFDIENYFLDVSVHEEPFQSACFRYARWHRPMLSQDGIAAHGMDYWKCFMDAPPIVGIECLKWTRHLLKFQSWP